jgi:hypothetical protein
MPASAPSRTSDLVATLRSELPIHTAVAEAESEGRSPVAAFAPAA